MIQSFNTSHPNIRVKGEHVPGDYTTKINTLMAANQLPDIAYLGDSLTMKWASEGRLLDLSSYYDEYPELKTSSNPPISTANPASLSEITPHWK